MYLLVSQTKQLVVALQVPEEQAGVVGKLLLEAEQQVVVLLLVLAVVDQVPELLRVLHPEQ